MMYALTLTTDEYTLRGEIYEREDKEGYEVRLRYTEPHPEIGPYPRELMWNSEEEEMEGFPDEKEAQEAIQYYLSNPMWTIGEYFS